MQFAQNIYVDNMCNVFMYRCLCEIVSNSLKMLICVWPCVCSIFCCTCIYLKITSFCVDSSGF